MIILKLILQYKRKLHLHKDLEVHNIDMYSF